MNKLTTKQLRMSIKMSKFTTEQLKAALIELYETNELAAYQLAFDELNLRMGDDVFDSWLDEVGI